MTRLTYLFNMCQKFEELGGKAFLIYLPIIRSLPFVEKIDIARVTCKPLSDFHVHAIVDTYFKNEDRMNEAMVSVEGKKLSHIIGADSQQAPEIFISEVLQ